MQADADLASPISRIVIPPGRAPRFRPGDHVRVRDRCPFGQYRLPPYLCGRIGLVDCVVEAAVIDVEAEIFGRKFRLCHPHYRIAFLMCDVWSHYPGGPSDGLVIEVFEPWLERVLA
jgi:hypothetical protein